jgi:hypothetical protein
MSCVLPHGILWMYQPLGSKEAHGLDPCALVVAVDATHTAIEVLTHPCEHVDLHAAAFRKANAAFLLA